MWGLGLVGWSWRFCQVEVLTFFRPSSHLSEPTFFLYLGGGRLVSLFSLAFPLDVDTMDDSFCNDLGIIYTASSQGRIFDPTTRDMGLELRYDFGKVLGIQIRPTLRLASSHCVLRLNPIKDTLNIVSILTHTLAHNMTSIIPKRPNHTSIMA